jgi:hypothetical protein
VNFSVGGAFLNGKSLPIMATASHQYFQQGLMLISEFKLHDVERTNFYVVKFGLHFMHTVPHRIQTHTELNFTSQYKKPSLTLTPFQILATDF